MQWNTKLGVRAAGVGLIAMMLFVAGCAKQAEDTPAVAPASDAAAPASEQIAGAGEQKTAQPDERTGKTVEDPKAKFTNFRVGENNVKAIYVDGKVVWVGTSDGVIRYNTETDDFRMFDNRDGLLSKGIFHVGKLDGRIVAGTYGGGMSIYNETSDKWENYNIPNGLADAFVYKVLKASNGDVWVATWSGANRVRGGDLKDRSKWDVYTVENTKGGLPNDWVYSLEEGKDGVIWFATEGGLARFKDDKWQNWNHDKGVGVDFEKIKNDPQFGTDPAKFSEHHARQAKEMGLEGVSGGGAYNPNYIVSLLVDKNGIVWCGTWGGGLARFDGSKWQNYSMADGLSGNHVFMLHQDPAGKMWVGTNNGLASFDGKKFKTELTKENGLFSNAVFAMGTGADASQWIGTYGAVTHLNSSNK
jgi:ligand-binding sensor domain-containing protein